MLKLMGKKIFSVLRSQILYIYINGYIDCFIQKMDFGSKFTYLSSGEEEEEVKESTVDRRSDESSDEEDDGEVGLVFKILNTFHFLFS